VLLSAHYRNELNFTFEGLDEATDAIQRLLDFRRRVSEFPIASGSNLGLAKGAREQPSNSKPRKNVLHRALFATQFLIVTAEKLSCISCQWHGEHFALDPVI
jgi:cysteinyl-tRNA synthetase